MMMLAAISEGELESYGLSRRPPLAQRSVMATRVASLEGRLFDGEGQVRQGLSDAEVGALLGEINDLRLDLGWLTLDLHHDHVWPEEAPSSPAPARSEGGRKNLPCEAVVHVAAPRLLTRGADAAPPASPTGRCPDGLS
jgi:hypothetical protein